MARTADELRTMWDMFEMTLPGETDPAEVPYHWHWLFFPLVDFFGPELVWSIGTEALGYPPTWAGTKPELQIVEDAVLNKRGV